MASRSYTDDPITAGATRIKKKKVHFTELQVAINAWETAYSETPTVFTDLSDELIANGDMELDASWGPYGSPTSEAQSAEQKNSGSWSWKIVAQGSNKGIYSSQFTTVYNYQYSGTAWIYPIARTDIRMAVRSGDNTQSAYEKVHSGLTTGQWNKVQFSWTDANPGTGAYFFGTANGADTFYIDDVVITAAKIQTAHMKELHDALDALRTLAGLGGYGWTQTVAKGKPIIPADINDARVVMADLEESRCSSCNTCDTFACSCDTSCDGDLCDLCDSTCNGFVACSCDSSCNNDLCDTCDGTCNAHSACSCNSTCNSDQCDLCDASCNGNVNCTCNSSCHNDACDRCDTACFGYNVCSCNQTNFGNSCSCNNTGGSGTCDVGYTTKSCTCNGGCNTYVVCTCNQTNFGATSCSCNQTCNSDLCDTCNTTCNGNVNCSCNSTCHNDVCDLCNTTCNGYVACTCDPACYNDLCDQCDSSCNGDVACTCNSTCHNDTCDTCDSACHPDTCNQCNGSAFRYPWT